MGCSGKRRQTTNFWLGERVQLVGPLGHCFSDDCTDVSLGHPHTSTDGGNCSGLWSFFGGSNHTISYFLCFFNWLWLGCLSWCPCYGKVFGSRIREKGGKFPG